MVDFGYTMVGEVGAPVLELAREADRRGFDFLGVMDHPYQENSFDMWTLLSVIATSTERIRVHANVTCTPLRPPAVLAKAVASLDVLSNGRVELGLGAGAAWDGIHAYGGPRRTPGQARAALEEYIDVVRMVWGQQREARFEGRYHQLRGTDPGPAPAHDIEIWLGVGGPRAVELVGRKADGWLPSLGPVPRRKLNELHARLDEAAVRAGRDPQAIRRLLNLSGIVGEGHGMITGPVELWVNRLVELAVDHRIDSFLFWPSADWLRQIQLFAEEVIPAVRRQLG
jgi:alkanesulfonate monooxygenase SsuD/methylene tetrahydromethanopterin reductase-like flavin-dependent oxidoreductase (luciferase family)